MKIIGGSMFEIEVKISVSVMFISLGYECL